VKLERDSDSVHSQREKRRSGKQTGHRIANRAERRRQSSQLLSINRLLKFSYKLAVYIFRESERERRRFRCAL
jgi:hypothetical protein